MKYTPEFEQFWNAYPVRKGKRAAFNIWQRMDGEIPPIEVLLAAIKAQETEKSYLRATNAFCPEWMYPQGWLHQARWEDEVEGLRQDKPKYQDINKEKLEHEK